MKTHNRFFFFLRLKIYFDHGDVLLLKCCTTDNSDRELTALIRRLECVTKGTKGNFLIILNVSD